MKQIFLFLIFILMPANPIQAQWKESTFFNDSRKTEYAIDLHFEKNIPLPVQDVTQLISILSAHKWEQHVDENKVKPEVNEPNWGRYHFYTKAYSLTITHPDKRKIQIRIDAKGIKKDVSQICSPTGEFQHAIRMNEGYSNMLSEDEVDNIMQLFWNNVTDFGNITYTSGQKAKISSGHSFTTIFSLKLPDIELTPHDSERLAKLYNKGWSIAAQFFPGGKPRPTIDLFNNSIYIYFDDTPYSYNPLLFKFSEKDQLAINQIVESAMKGHDGTNEVEFQKVGEIEKQTIRYQYKNGLLHNDVEVFNANGKITHRITYDKNTPVRYISYGANGKACIEVLFLPTDRRLEWIEYDKKGRVLDSGKNYYFQKYLQQDIDLFYKSNH